MSDQELVAAHGGVGDPFYRDMILAEERRRTSETAIIQAGRSNWIVVGSLAVAIASLMISVLSALR